MVGHQGKSLFADKFFMERMDTGEFLKVSSPAEWYVVWSRNGTARQWGTAWEVKPAETPNFIVEPPIGKAQFKLGPRLSRVTLEGSAKQADGWIMSKGDREILTFIGFPSKADEPFQQPNTARDVISNLSHELRTPIHGINGIADVLLTSDLDLRLNKLVHLVKKSAERLTHITDSLINFMAMEQGVFQWDPIDVNLEDVLDDLASQFGENARSKGIELSVYIENPDELNVRADIKLTTQILKEVLTNALKFTEKGEIAVGVHHKVVDDIIEVYFEISDSGCGIPKSDLDRIFLPFVQSSNGLSRVQEGAGLGLYIVQLLVDHLRGRLEIESNLQGTKVSITLPFQRCMARSHWTNKKELLGMRGIYVDDNKTARKLMEHLLQSHGGSVTLYSRAGEAFDALQNTSQEDIDFILLDYQMPDMNGKALSQKINTLPNLRHVPRIMISAVPELTKVQPEQLYVSEVVAKPFRRKRIIRTILNSVKTDHMINENFKGINLGLSLISDAIDKALTEHLCEEVGLRLKAWLPNEDPLEQGEAVSFVLCDSSHLEVVPKLRARFDPQHKLFWICTFPQGRPILEEDTKTFDMVVQKPITLVAFFQIKRLLKNRHSGDA